MDPAHRHVHTREQMLADVCVLYGGLEAEKLLLGDNPSWGCAQDLLQATEIVRDMVEIYGMGGLTGVGRYRHTDGPHRRPELSQIKLAELDRRVDELLSEARDRAAAIVHSNRAIVETLRDLLVDKKVIDARALVELVPALATRGPSANGAGGDAAAGTATGKRRHRTGPRTQAPSTNPLDGPKAPAAEGI
jgi:cell division protease FtsH